MRRLDLTAEDMRDLLGGHTINAMIEGGEEVIAAAPDGPSLRDIADAADTAADLAYNRMDDTSHSEYVDPSIEEKAYATGVHEFIKYLLGEEPTEALQLVLRAGRHEDDDAFEE